ncbi:MAG: pyridoxal phosphate-dependent aminotransferase [Polyangiaceae bacterium]
MQWAKTRFVHQPPRYHLASSGLTPPEGIFADGLDDPQDVTAVAEAQRAVAARYRVDVDRVTLTMGTSHAFFLLCASQLRPGDRCLVEQPCYPMLQNLPGLFGAETHRFERSFADGFAIPGDLVARIEALRPRLVLLANPHNPSGVVAPLEALRPIAEAVRSVGGVLGVDEVYLEYFPDAVARSALSLGEGVAVGASLTKAYGFGPLRFGWLVGDAPVVRQAVLYDDYVMVHYPAPAAAAALRVLERLDQLAARAGEVRARGLASVEAFVASRDDVSWHAPDAGVVGLLRLHGVADTMGFVERLVEEEETIVVPGEFFGAPGFVRLGFGGDPPMLEEGLRRLGRLLDATRTEG